MSDELAWLDATAQAERVRSGEVKPLELVQAAIGRVEARNPELNAMSPPLRQQHIPSIRVVRLRLSQAHPRNLRWSFRSPAPFQVLEAQTRVSAYGAALQGEGSSSSRGAEGG